MSERLTLSRSRLETFLTCQRRFELRYLRRLPWPSQPLDAKTDAALTLGQQFHRLLERHFLGLSIDASALGTGRLLSWWRAFEQSGLPNGRYSAKRPELTLTVPLGNFLLTGRFDLLTIGETTSGEPTATLFDWKTSRPRTIGELEQDWQSRLYLAMVVEGGDTLLGGNGRFLPENIGLIYWYASEPTAPRTVRYSAEQHHKNWAELVSIANDIEAANVREAWPLTETRAHCTACTYRVFCGRHEEETAVSPASLDIEEPEEDWLLHLDPHTP